MKQNSSVTGDKQVVYAIRRLKKWRWFGGDCDELGPLNSLCWSSQCG